MVCARRLVPALALLVATASAVGTRARSTERPTVVIAELDGIIHPIAAEYLTGVIDDADSSNAELVVVVLRTPGGLLESTRAIVSRIITSRAPVVVFVGPSGARAASAGFILTLAADVAAMAPGTHIGAAHPVAGDGQKMDDTVSRKAASDTAAYVRSIAEARHRNVALARRCADRSTGAGAVDDRPQRTRSSGHPRRTVAGRKRRTGRGRRIRSRDCGQRAYADGGT